ncbi:NUDIX hydrolase [Sellimonas sp.]|uniref:NUDIX hydrolase n=1 Tax=Sellimonas sp. TaxID=2021466 RepID=UPI0025810D4D|nr:8-oxo-dGTP diphosphatase [Sellimonas sp.]
MPKVQMTTLGYIEKDDSYLMLHRVKKKNDVNQDKWIGIGGKFEYGESPEECLIREAKEETGLLITSWKFRGILTFICDKQDPEYICLYTADKFEGELKECGEGTLEWIRKEEVLNLNLWEGDKIFFNLIAKDAPFFSLKLAYENDSLKEAVLDGEKVLVAR